MSGKIKVWMPLLVGDYLADTQHLTTCEHGAYLLIIMHQWMQGHMREQDLRRIARMDPDAWSIAQASIKHLLSIDDSGLFFSPKCDRLKDEWLGKSQRAHEKAQKAAKTRWERVRAKRAQDGMPGAMLEQCPSSSSVTPPLSANAPSGGGGASAEAPPPPGSGSALPATAARPDAPSMPASSEHRRRRLPRSKGRAKVQEIEHNGSLSASLRPQARVRAKTVSTPRNGTRKSDTGPTLVDVVTGTGMGSEDPRYERFRNLLTKFYAEVNGDTSNGNAWSIKSDQALRVFLERNSGFTEPELITCLTHRADAIAICSEHPPKKGVVSARDTIANVVDQLLYFKHHPADAFGRRLA